ncbi:MAG: GDSL-type esterase/lipase family protein [Chthoniobacteraceae bacterium]
MKLKAFSITLACLLTVTASIAVAQSAPNAAAASPSTIPVQRTEEWAIISHEQIKRNVTTGRCNVIFLGDSITHRWKYAKGPAGGAAIWEKYWSPLGAGCMGIPADKIQNVLWRITEGGELDGTNGKVVVLMIGINNLNVPDVTPQDAADGIKAIVDHVKTTLPGAKVLVMGILPCWNPGTHLIRGKVSQTNEMIQKLEDLKQVYYLDLGAKLLEPDGSLSKEKMPDAMHPSEVGYEILAKLMQPYLEDLLKNGGQGELWKKRVDGKLL